MNSTKDLTVKQQRILENELDKGERVSWIASPKPKFFTKASMGTFLFGIPWTAFPIFWVAMAAGGIWGNGGAANAPFVFKFFPLFGVPFILIGLGMLSTPYWSYLKSKKTFYAITDQRVIIFSGGRSITVSSFPPEQLGSTYRTIHPDGTGDVANEYGLRLERVTDPKRVEDLIEQLAQQVDPQFTQPKDSW